MLSSSVREEKNTNMTVIKRPTRHLIGRYLFVDIKGLLLISYLFYNTK